MGLGWKWWTKAYFRVLFSRELWFSWYFIVLEILMFYGIWATEDPLGHAARCLSALLFIAVIFTTMGMMEAYSIKRKRLAVDKEIEERRLARNEQLRGRASTPVVEEPSKPPEKSPWYLGTWDNKGT